MAGFVHAFYIYCGLPATWQSLFDASIFVYTEGLIGELVDLGESECNLTAPGAQVLYLGLSSVLLIVMMNFLIAVMSDSYARVQEHKDAALNLMRAELVAEVETLITDKAATENAYLFVCQEARNQDAGAEDTWQAKLYENNQMIRADFSSSNLQFRKQQDRLAMMEGQLQSMSTRLQAVEDTVTTGQDNLQQTLNRLVELVSHGGASTPSNVAGMKVDLDTKQQQMQQLPSSSAAHCAHGDTDMKQQPLPSRSEAHGSHSDAQELE